LGPEYISCIALISTHFVLSNPNNPNDSYALLGYITILVSVI